MKHLINGILLDMEGVIYDATVWHRWLFQKIRRLGVVGDFESFFRIWQIDFWPDWITGHSDFWELTQRYLTEIGLSQPQIDEVLVGGRPRWSDFQKSIRPLPQIQNALWTIRGSGITIGVVANVADSESALQSKLRQFGFADVVDFVVTSHSAKRLLPSEPTLAVVRGHISFDVGEIALVSNHQSVLHSAKEMGLCPIGCGSGIEEYPAIDHLKELSQRVALGCERRDRAA